MPLSTATRETYLVSRFVRWCRRFYGRHIASPLQSLLLLLVFGIEQLCIGWLLTLAFGLQSLAMVLAFSPDCWTGNYAVAQCGVYRMVDLFPTRCASSYGGVDAETHMHNACAFQAFHVGAACVGLLDMALAVVGILLYYPLRHICTHS